VLPAWFTATGIISAHRVDLH